MSAGEKMLHVVYRVGDLKRTGEFLTALGMKHLRGRDVPEGKYTNEFYGYGSESKGEHFSLELTYNYGVESYEVGTGLEAFMVASDDPATTTGRLEAAGFSPKPALDGHTEVVDPTGYRFKFKQGTQRDPMTGICFNVSDLAASIKFYTSIGMTSNPDGVLSYGDSEDTTVLKLTQSSDVSVGTGYGQIAVSTPDVYVLAESMKKNGITLAREPGPVPGIGTKITAVRDPDGYKIVFVDAADFEGELV